MALTWLRQLVASLSLRRTGLNPMLIHVDFVVDKVVLEKDFLSKLRVSPPPPSRIPPRPILNTLTLLILEKNGRYLESFEENIVLWHIEG